MTGTYNNRTGIVKEIQPLSILIDDDLVTLKSDRAKDIVTWSRVRINDEVEYNVHSQSHELIFLRVTGHKHYEPKSFEPSRDVQNICCGQEGGGEMADMSLASQDAYDLFWDGM